jgi:hypothetical protein
MNPDKKRLLVQKRKNTWKMAVAEAVPNVEWQLFKSDILINNTIDTLTILPSYELCESIISDNAVLLVSCPLKNIIHILHPGMNDRIWEVSAKINKQGNTEADLSEPEINKALRYIFKRKPNKVYISLENSYYNNSHEMNLRNVLRVAGYTSICSTTLKPE